MLPDHEAMAVGCVAELTRTTTDSSALTGDTSRDFSLHMRLQSRFPAEVSDQNFVDDEQGEKSALWPL
ncbi:hypothetical protein GH714_016650 [Hevea brasiliensis]|uniref:Uncharacterized protein n=1 Tax=Hevea brasiliensis TaxID=3981 RepID=A0A6A6L0A7_HEVBR|nr:hypothetical protein GH714_016650 [Hevea brasiliensis]